jgi:hypothetical protein
MIKYEIVKSNINDDTFIKRTDEDGKEWFIPPDPANSDYQAYLKYLEENN